MRRGFRGNLGASLNGVWGSGTPEDSEDVEESQIPDSPEGHLTLENEDSGMHENANETTRSALA